MGFSSAFGQAGHQVARGPRARRLAAVALVGVVCLGGCQAGEGAQAPAVSSTESQSDLSSDGSNLNIDPDVSEIAAKSEAETRNNVTLSEFRDYVSDPYNTYIIREMDEVLPGAVKDGAVDPLAQEYLIILESGNDPQMLEALLNEKRITSDILVETYKWYRDNADEIQYRYEQPGINPAERDKLWYARAGEMACILIAKQVADGRVRLQERYGIGNDPDLEEFLREAQGNESIYTNYLDDGFILGVRDGKIDKKADLKTLSSRFMSVTTFETIGSLRSSRLTGSTAIAEPNSSTYDFLMMPR